MGIANALFLFVMIWFLVFMVALAMPFQTQGEAGKVVPGTPASAPARINFRRRVRFTTVVALLLCVAIWGAIQAGLIPLPGSIAGQV